jgi:hypothetical protein
VRDAEDGTRRKVVFHAIEEFRVPATGGDSQPQPLW